jgi:hypothetical protein
VLSPATAFELLQRADNPNALGQIAAALGFTGRAELVAAEVRVKLGLPQDVLHAQLIAGRGTLRALVTVLANDASARETIFCLARGLSTRARHCDWLVLGCGGAGATSFVAAWLAGQSGPSVRSLVVDRHHVYASDTETLCALAACREDVDVLVYSRWLEILGRDGLTRRFFATLSGVVDALRDDMDCSVPSAARAELALLVVSRLLFLSFIQCKGWLNGDHAFLQNAFAAAADGRAGVHRRLLNPLFFGTLNTRMSSRQRHARAFGRVPYLNGGLFSRTHLERVHRRVSISDAALGLVFGDLLSRYRFTPREDATDWSEAAVDPDILGRAFESLMDAQARRSSGTFYTPSMVVERATRAALTHALENAGVDRSAIRAALVGAPIDAGEGMKVVQCVGSVRVLDPACGSGAFLVHMLRVLSELRVLYGGDTRAGARAAVLAGSIHGVDLSATAVWLCQLRLWLCLAVECDAEDASGVPPLPNLDRNIRIGDSLGSTGRTEHCGETASAELSRLRSRYARAQGQRKRTLLRALDGAERRVALRALEATLGALTTSRREIISAARSPDLFGGRSSGRADEQRRLRLLAKAVRREHERLRRGGALSFSYPVQFADVMDAGGFDVVVGNPPWVRPHHVAVSTRNSLRERFAVCRTVRGSRRTPFGAQIDLAAPFVERSLDLLREGGTLALLLPAKLWSSLAGASLRQHLLRNSTIVALEDFSDSRALFAAATYPALLVAARTNGGSTASGERMRPTSALKIVIHRRSGSVEWQTQVSELSVERGESAPWLLVPPPVRRAYERIARAGVALSATPIGAPRLGVKTGCNEAFIVRTRTRCRDLAEVYSGERSGWVEQSLLRPVLRGELVRAWRPPQPAEHIIWTHDHADRPLARLPAHAARWLRQWRHELDTRTDARAGGVWWRLFRTAAARHDVHRVVWNDIGRSPRALVLEPGDGTVPINTCYVAFARERVALALAALLNGPLAAAWLHVLAEPARGGYRRYMAWTIASLPVPAQERVFRDTLAPLGEAARAGEDVSPAQLLDAALAAYGLRHRDVAPLLEWRDV